MDKRLKETLSVLDPATLSYEEWVEVGMALKHEGEDASVFEEWSARDPVKYHPGEPAKKWETFKEQNAGEPVRAGTIVEIARRHHADPTAIRADWEAEIYGWNDKIPCVSDEEIEKIYGTMKAPLPSPNVRIRSPLTGASAMLTYLRVLFKEDDMVSIVTDAFICSDGRAKLTSGKTYSVSTLQSKLQQGIQNGDPQAIERAVGKWIPQVGAYVRFNPVDGEGVKDSNITDFRYALVESDEISTTEQIDRLKDFNLPIAAMVHSGGKSIHAIVRVDAPNREEYKRRVAYLYDFLDDHGFQPDRQDRNPSRLSRLPGVTRGENEQYLIATNIGAKNFDAWLQWQMDHAEQYTVMHTDVRTEPKREPELIEGVLRRGHKMIIGAASKAGKTFFLMELAIKLQTGGKWIGLQCAKSNVLYVDMELADSEFSHRLYDLAKEMQVDPLEVLQIGVIHLRGKNEPLSTIVKKISNTVINAKIDGHPYDVIIIDPIYKVLAGDENKTDTIAKFCAEIDRLTEKTKCAAIYSHHHSKGAQGQKNAMDRMSGTGVLARDPDAIVDIIQLEIKQEEKDLISQEHGLNLKEYATAWRVSFELREFEPHKPIDMWFSFPLHIPDLAGVLKDYYPRGAPENAQRSSSKRLSPVEKKNDLDIHFKFLDEKGNGYVTVEQLAEDMVKTQRYVRDLVNSTKGYVLDNGIVFRSSVSEEDAEAVMAEQTMRKKEAQVKQHDQQIADAIADLNKENEKPLISKVAEKLDVSRNTLKKYIDESKTYARDTQGIVFKVAC